MPLNINASEVISFLEDHFLLQNGRPIKFEPWQKEHVLTPVFERTKHSWDTFLFGLPKKNGKSTLAAAVTVYALLLDDPYPEVYSTAGDLAQARIIFRSTEKALKTSKLNRYLKFYRDAIERRDGNGVYRALASDAPGSHGLNASAVFWDEIWNQPSYDLWEALTLSPARMHPFHFITTYAGYQARSGNLLWDLYQRGVTGSEPNQYTFWSSGENANLASWVTPKYLESQRRQQQDYIYRRLHMNEWSIAESTKAFRIPAECWGGCFEEAIPSASYVVGIDLAKSLDFTAWCVLRTDVKPMRVVDIGKLPHMDYTHQVELLDACIQRFGNPRAMVDAGAAGTAVVELMRKRNWRVEEISFTNDSKARLVTDLAVGFEQRQIVLPQRGRTLDENRAIADLEKELFNFEPTVLRSGRIRYEASGAYHDDMVMALCLAWSAKQAPWEPWIEVIFPRMDEERFWRRI